MLNQRERRLTLAYSSVGHFFSHLFVSAYTLVAVDLAAQGAFGLAYADLLPLIGVGLFLFGACALPAGMLADRWSAPGMLVVFLVGTGLAACATGFAEGPVSLWLGLTAIGLFGSIYHPVGLAWLTRDRVGRGWMLGVNGLAGNLALGLGPLIAGILIDLLSWRAVFFLPGALCALTGVAMAAVWARGGFAGGERLAAEAVVEAAPGEMRRALLILLIAVICTGTVFNALSAVLPQFVADSSPGLADRGMTWIGAVVAPLYLLGGLLQIATGWLADRLPVKPLYVLCWILQLLAFVALAAVIGPAALPIVLLATSAGLASLTPENMMFVRLSPPAWRSTMYGLKFILVFGLGWPAVEAAAWLYGVRESFDGLFVALACLAGAGVLAAVALPSGGSGGLRLVRPRWPTSKESSAPRG